MYALARLSIFLPKPALLLTALAVALGTLWRGHEVERREPIPKPFPFFGE